MVYWRGINLFPIKMIGGLTMKLLKTFLASQLLMLAPFLPGFAEADDKQACHNMFSPLQNVALKIKSEGGTWELFEKREIFRKHAIVGLHVDSKITTLITNIDYLCESQQGIPRNRVAAQVVPMLEEKGAEGFIEYYLGLFHSIDEIKGWVKYAEYFIAHHKRQLDINQTQKTIENARPYFDRYQELAIKLKTTNDIKGIAKDGKALIEDIVRFNAEDPLLKQASHENAQIPQVSALTNISDEM